VTALTLWAASVPVAASAQTPAAPAPSGVVRADGSAGSGGGVVQAGCSTCGGGGGVLGEGSPPPLGGDFPNCAGGCGGGCSSCGCGGHPCYPGYYGCDCCCDGQGPIRGFLCGLYHCICCPDPCYEPCFVPLANASFFVDSARPVTQIRLRGDFGSELQFPDKAEWFWAQENVKGPHFPNADSTGKLTKDTLIFPKGSQAPGEPNVDYSRGLLYNEVAVERFSFFTEINYLNVEPTLYPAASGFGDMNLGTKSLLLDCELMQFTFQFKTYLPTGNFTKGLGNHLVSLEPSLLTAIKITSTTYFQAQTAFWWPVGNTDSFSGPIFHYHLSLNQLLWSCGHDIQVIGTAELNGYDISGGSYTSPANGLPASAKEVTEIVSIGPGIRLSVCNKIDIGAGSAFQISHDRMERSLARVEFRWRF
jgi:hypothetical protein